MLNNSNESLLIFDDISPSFNKPKKIIKSLSINKYVLKYSVKGPDDCKHILSSFRNKLNMIWSQLESDNSMKAAEVPSYLRGVAMVIKNIRPEEFEELKVLITLAKQILSEKQ